MQIQRSFRLLAKSLLAAAILAGLFAAPALLTAQQPYHILNRWKIGGEGRWDYLHADPAAHRLYIAHGPGVDVIDTRTGKPIGAITGLHGTHGIALDTVGKYGYISDGGGNAVVVFDRATLATVATIPTGANPDGIIFEPATQTVWAFNGRSQNVTVIDAATRTVVATIALPGKPEFPAVDGKGTVFDNIESKSEIVRLDARAKKVTAEWPAGCDSPSGLAFDVAGHRLFPVCRGQKMSVIDSNSGKLLANPAIGNGPDAARWSAKHKLAFASCGGDGVLSVVDAGAAGYPTIETLPTQRGARTMAYDPSTDRIYLATAEFGPRPAPTAENPRPRPAAVPNSFTIIVVGR
ncbi:MAG: YncE family protein [Acidobacteriota bacterium]|nr:YncE family protein [Acidobacteriota bacterium]